MHDFTRDGPEALDALLAARPATPDPGREGRKGVPEVVLAEGKPPEVVLEITRRLLAEAGRAILSRVPADLADRLRLECQADTVEHYAAARMMVVRRPGLARPAAGGCVGVLTAGTSDVPVAEEAAVIAREMGCRVEAAYDVGVAGLHRLVEPLRRLLEAQADVLIVAAGMDGALPSVVAGLVDVPVIGLPTSVGYGLGGRGVAALLSMLQTCSPGLVVVNIDNGIGAGSTAALIARRVAAARGNRAMGTGGPSTKTYGGWRRPPSTP
ncbi:MAG: nickel pincer cofactor biosynthesis protein LarB, partial [Chloroflexi bacterium]|nr:nickel pincer cofactor biosynthesis protein LarB [Chloroflexota bacterium]